MHADQRRSRRHHQVVPGGTVTERWVPVRRVGLYVPGGLAVYPSSVVMNVVPAQIAGVDAIAVASPPQRETGGLTAPGGPGRLRAARRRRGLRGRRRPGDRDVRVRRPGECEPVDLITGPGNVYVTAAKRLLRGAVGIDAEAGPTEIAILADDTADPAHVAADLISQAEHDPMAASVLVTDSARNSPTRSTTSWHRRSPPTKHSERITTALTGPQSARRARRRPRPRARGRRRVRRRAPGDPDPRRARRWAARVRNAGAIFVGAWSPVSLGDYCAGSNHVLPTGGCARHSGGLSVQTFLRGVQLIEYDEAALREVRRPRRDAGRRRGPAGARSRPSTARFPR